MSCAAPHAQGRTTPYGPLVAALRPHLRLDAGAFDDLRPAAGAPRAAAAGARRAGGRAAIARRCSRRCAARSRRSPRPPSLILLDDLHWSDAATLELLGGLAEPLTSCPLLSIGAYRSDGLPRDHALRRLRNDLRRAGRLEEIALEPLEPPRPRSCSRRRSAGAGAVARARRPRPHRGRSVLRRGACARAGDTGALTQSARASSWPRGRGPAAGHGPRRRAARAAELPEDARAAADAAAVEGQAFDIDARRGGSGRRRARGSDRSRAGQRGRTPGARRFRHALTREAIYADIPWLRRRGFTALFAEALERRRAGPRSRPTGSARATTERARAALLRAAAESRTCTPIATRPTPGARRSSCGPRVMTGAATRGARALRALSELAGDLTEAIRAWRELGDLLAAERVDRSRMRSAACGRVTTSRVSVNRRSGCGAWQRRVRGAGQPDEAAVEHIAMANHLRAPAATREARELAGGASEAERRAASTCAARARARGHGRPSAATTKAGLADRARRSRAGARTRPHRRGRGALPAAEPRALRGGRLPRAGRRSTPRSSSAERAGGAATRTHV